ncbi:MAG: hypothetical protein OEW41_09910 [Actinomycetota bacterium]|nr:hypothetical protein [Actinomycetota bacterium]
MELVEKSLLVLHFVGLASLLGGFLVQARSRPRQVNPAMFHGALTQLVTGLLLVGVLQGMDEPVNNAKIGVKLLVLALILALVVANRKKDAVPDGVWGAIGGLTVLNIVLAVFW